MEAKKLEEYYADLYLRLSREDGDKAESDSIANQEMICQGYFHRKFHFFRQLK